MNTLLPAPLNENILLVTDAMNNDIIQSIHKLFPVAVLQTKEYAKRFKGKNAMQTARNVWDFEKSKIKYKRDPNVKQMIRLPNRFVHDADGDCKSYALFAASILANLGYPVWFRYAGYRKGSDIPTHVYCVTADEKGKEIIVDGVYRSFNQEKPYEFKKDYKMEVLALADNVGEIGKLRLPGSKLRKKILKAHLKMLPKPLRKGAVKRLKLAGKLIPAHKKLKSAFENDLGYLGTESYTEGYYGIYGKKKKKKKKGRFFKKIGKSLKKVSQIVKKVSLVPMRKSFQALVAINFMALAGKLKLALKKKPGKVEKLWKKLGGNPSVLIKTINKGAKKKPIFGKNTKGVKGIGVAPAALLVSAGTILTAFASILKGLKGDGGKSGNAAGDEHLDNIIKESAATADKEVLNNVNNGSGYSAEATTDSGSDYKTGPNESENNTSTDTESDQPDGNTDNSKMYLIGGAVLVGALFLMNKKK